MSFAGYEYIVFNSYAEFAGDVDSGFDSNDVSGGEGAIVVC